MDRDPDQTLRGLSGTQWMVAALHTSIGLAAFALILLLAGAS